MKKLATLKKKMLTDPAVRKAYDGLTPEYDIARELIKESKNKKPTRWAAMKS